MFKEANKIKVVVFDWDGTLMNSMDQVVDAFIAAVKNFALPVPSRDIVRRRIGIGHDELWRLIFDEMDVEVKTPPRDEFWQEFYRHYRSSSVSLYDSTLPTIASLNSHGYQCAIATNKPHHSFVEEFDQWFKPDQFSLCLCADQYKEKPDPAMLHVIQKDLKVESENILMVGDTTFDIQSAKNASCYSYGVECGNMNAQELLAAGADGVGPEVDSLLTWLGIEEKVVQ